jgi:NADH:ubiquinone oxidoreductase subunit 6 (subunit J)
MPLSIIYMIMIIHFVTMRFAYIVIRMKSIIHAVMNNVRNKRIEIRSISSLLTADYLFVCICLSLCIFCN